jgi:hypothetical protein
MKESQTVYPRPVDFRVRSQAVEVSSPEKDRRVDFAIRRNGLSLSANVSEAYFEATVIPVITTILQELAGTPAADPANESAQQVATKRAETPPSLRTVIEKTEATNAAEIMKAAAVSLTLIHGKARFTREELLDEVGKASGYWRKSHAQGASHILSYLLKSGTLVESADGGLSLEPTEERKAVCLLGSEQWAST